MLVNQSSSSEEEEYYNENNEFEEGEYQFEGEMNDLEDEDDEDDDSNIFLVQDNMRYDYANIVMNNPTITNHPFIRNYRTIVSFEHFIKPEIAECFYLESGEYVAILKTFWIRIFQRKWRTFIREKKRFIRFCSQPWVLFYREINGKWPQMK